MLLCKCMNADCPNPHYGDSGHDAREHMKRCPEHEMTIDSNDEWCCLTCEAEEGNNGEAMGGNRA